MDGKKVYQIQINGIQESVNAVEALNKQLNELENRIKALEKSNVKVGTSSSSGGGSKSSLNEEEKLAKQIQQIDAKRKAYSKEIYQNYLAAKDVLDETVKDQKTISAQERLQANNYTNTMAGLKQELKDLKTVMNGTDLGDEAFGEMTQRANELTTKLKELEAAYGQFGRNVGNYQSAFDGLGKVSVTINGMVQEFDNLKQATKALRDGMGVLEVQGKKDTKIYKEMERELEKVSKAQLRLNSAMNDAKSSSKAMDDLLDTFESFAALGQVGQGFSTLFGFDNSALEQQIAKLVALQNILQGIEKIRQQMNTGEGVGGWFSKGSKAVDQFVAKLTGAKVTMDGLSASSRGATLAVQGLSTALKFVGGSIATIGLSVLLETFTKVIGKLKEWAFGSMDAAEATEIASNNFDVLNRRLKEFEKQNSKAVFDGIMTSEEALAYKTSYLTKELTQLLNAFTNLRQLSNEDWFSKAGIINGIQGAQKRFEDLQVDIVNLDKEAKKSWLPDWIVKLTNGGYRAEKQFENVGRALAVDFLGRAKTTINEFEKTREEAQRQMDKMGKVNPETQKKLEFLKRQISQIRDEMNNNQIYGNIFDNIDKFAKDSPFFVRAINNVRESLNALGDTISDTNFDPSKLEQLKIDALQDSEEKIRRQNKLNREKELQEVGDNKEYIDAINAKYKRELDENIKAFRKSKKQELDQKKKEERDIQREIDEYTIQLMREGLEKQITELRNEEKYKRKEIEDSGIRVSERTNLLTEVYNKKELELRRDWAREVKKIYEDLYRNIEEIERDNASKKLDTRDTSQETSTSKDKRSAGDNLITPINYDNIDALKAYYKKILEIEQKAADDEARIRQERLKKQMEYDKEDEKRRHSGLTDSENGEYKKQLEQGKITQEQYDKLIEDENKAHAERMKLIDTQYAADSEKILQDSLDNKSDAYNRYYTSVIAEIRKQQDKISKFTQKAEVTDTAGFGIINIVQTKKNYKILIDAQKEAIDKIQDQKKKLIDDKNSGKIKGEDFLVRKEELDAAEEAAMASLENLEKNSKNVFGKFMQSIQQYVQYTMQSIQSVLSAVWDAEEIAFDKEQEAIDKENEALDEKLSEQESIIESHKSAVESIEDELATARGDRRQHLIDQLNAEMAAEREAAKQKQKIQKEQEALAKKQEALDKKRKKAQYKRDLTQAIVSGALAVVNGLATVPFVPTGIAMAALAAAATAAQIAIMASNKPYAKGGQLDGGVAQGNRHRDGGIKVLGGRAEIEGGEFITNRQTTAKNVDLLEFINSKKKRIDINDLMEFYSTTPRKSIKSVRSKFEDGGFIPSLPSSLDIRDQLQNVVINQDNRPIVVSVVDINNKQEDVRRVQALAGL